MNNSPSDQVLEEKMDQIDLKCYETIEKTPETIEKTPPTLQYYNNPVAFSQMQLNLAFKKNREKVKRKLVFVEQKKKKK